MPDPIAYWTLIATAASAVASAIALGFNAYELRQNGRSRDAEWLFRFLSEIRENERAFLNAPPGDEQGRALVDYVNFLNSAAGACQKGLLPKHTHAFLTDYLVEAIATIETEGFAERLERMRTSSSTFIELADFYKSHRRQIERAVAEQRILNAAADNTLQADSAES
ncbi:hypothetical protein [Mesorhizobium sp. B2-3-4]|uniref:hypothetical protein n=1 Tax=Mesorhizobium sp. B2-3-4 TaxID=2589959 RepID=UPI0011283A94|nr:hypothetical protein [Mesorhizobium sp. B2-3-4]TPM41387.1 hypothetical protein FJ967_00170 [Mesorhizobium sp. B2-3-4]